MTRARRTLWTSLALGFLLPYVPLFTIMRGASRRLIRQPRRITLLAGR